MFPKFAIEWIDKTKRWQLLISTIFLFLADLFILSPQCVRIKTLISGVHLSPSCRDDSLIHASSTVYFCSPTVDCAVASLAGRPITKRQF